MRLWTIGKVKWTTTTPSAFSSQLSHIFLRISSPKWWTLIAPGSKDTSHIDFLHPDDSNLWNVIYGLDVTDQDLKKRVQVKENGVNEALNDLTLSSSSSLASPRAVAMQRGRRCQMKS